MAYKKLKNLSIENAEIFARNFSGRENEYNQKGVKTFCVEIDDPDIAQHLAEDGWNVKIRAVHDEGEEPKHYIPVVLRYFEDEDDYRNPVIKMITKRKQVLLNDHTVNALDDVEIRNVDLVIRPFHWVKNGREGVKAYVKAMYVVIEEDKFAEKYAMEEGPEEF